MIKVEDLWFGYNEEVYVLKGIDFTFNGGILTIIGPNGAGKTTLLKIIGGILKPTRGRVLIDGMDLWKLDGKARIQLRRKIVYVHEKPVLFKGTVIENVAYPLKIRGLKGRKCMEKALKFLKLMEIDYLAEEKASDLSAGQIQLVALARALAAEPKYLLLDEPTSNLDTRRERMVLNLIKHLAKKGKTIIVSSHRRKFIEISEKTLLLNEGRIQAL
ncbi:MAG: ATP-binding cassette domain-containing protein [Thermoproteales archaeon]|nr:ATP-binding cassette domain-containing protein [Thermoproteales archaeon]RLE65502.1 MAG: hypothetical protein DRJ47_04840 [Thermoprotei archaeon]